MVSKNTLFKSGLTLIFMIWLSYISLGHQLDTYYQAVQSQLGHVETQLRNETVFSKRIINIVGPSPLTKKMEFGINLFNNAPTIDTSIDAIKNHHQILSQFLGTLDPKTLDERVIAADIKPLFDHNTKRLEDEWSALYGSITWYNQKLTQFPYTIYLKFSPRTPLPIIPASLSAK